MHSWLRQLDALLRGERTGDDAAAVVPLPRLVGMVIALGATYGCFMGWYAVALRWQSGTADGWLQLVASTVKLPLLFLVTIAVTFPSLYVFSALAGLRLDFTQTLRIIVAALVVMLTVAASLGPILGFFTFSTSSYPFMVVLNVVLLGIAGFIGLGFMRRVLDKFSAQPEPNVAPTAQRTGGTGAADSTQPPASQSAEPRPGKAISASGSRCSRWWACRPVGCCDRSSVTRTPRSHSFVYARVTSS